MESSNKWYEKVPVQKEGENAMSEAMLALLGFATIIIVIALLLRNVTVPALAFVSVSTVTGAILVATGTFTISFEYAAQNTERYFSVNTQKEERSEIRFSFP